MRRVRSPYRVRPLAPLHRQILERLRALGSISESSAVHLAHLLGLRSSVLVTTLSQMERFALVRALRQPGFSPRYQPTPYGLLRIGVSPRD